MKKKFKEGDVVMILPHKAHSTIETIGTIGIVSGFLYDDIPIVKTEFYQFAYWQNDLFKIGDL